MIPIIPELNEKQVGIAFGSFGVAKLLAFIPAGIIVDKFGNMRAISFMMLCQCLAILSFIFLGNNPLFGQLLEGASIALGTVGSLTFLRLVSKNAEQYRKYISKIIGIGGVGFLIGPVISYLLLKESIQVALYGLLIINVSIFIIQIIKDLSSKKDIEPFKFEISSSNSMNINWKYILLTLFIVKFIQFGLQPNFAWWNKYVFEFDALTSGAVYLSIGVGFMIGAMIQRFYWTYLLPIGMLMFEVSFTQYPFLFWPGIILVSIWLGYIITQSVSILGFRDPSQLGKKNSMWLLISDLSLVFGPVILWELRLVELWKERVMLIISLVLVAIVSFIYGKQKQVFKVK